MKNLLKKLFGKDERNIAVLPKKEKATFVVKVDDIELGILNCENGEWVFRYTEAFKNSLDKYTHIIGFPDVNREYRSETLWPFFRIRIPGLKQPAVQEILEKEHINEEDEVALLKQFGYKTIANPYTLMTL